MPTVNKGFGLLFEMGCGKTLTAIAIAGAAYQMGYIKKVLVIAPASVLSVWPQELEESADFSFTASILTGTKNNRIKILTELEEHKTDALKIAAINYEATWRDDIYEALLEYDADLIICDESQRIKSHRSKQSKAVHSLGDKARYKLILSGTPIQNTAEDIWSQYRFLDANVFGYQFTAFKNYYCKMGGYNNKQVAGVRNIDELIRHEYSIAFRVTKEEALDLPEQVFIERPVMLKPETQSIYSAIKDMGFAVLDTGETVTAHNVMTELVRLQQITGGFLGIDKDTGEEYREPKPVGDEKLQVLTSPARSLPPLQAAR